MEYRYTYKWGFVWRVPKEDFSTEHTFVNGWTSYRFHTKMTVPIRLRPGQVIDVNCDADKAFKFLQMPSGCLENFSATRL